MGRYRFLSNCVCQATTYEGGGGRLSMMQLKTRRLGEGKGRRRSHPYVGTIRLRDLGELGNALPCPLPSWCPGLSKEPAHVPGSVAGDSQMNEWAEVTRNDLAQAVLGMSVQPHKLIGSTTLVLGVWLRPPRYFPCGGRGGRPLLNGERFPWRTGGPGPAASLATLRGLPHSLRPTLWLPRPTHSAKVGGCGLCPCRGQLGLLSQNKS